MRGPSGEERAISGTYLVGYAVLAVLIIAGAYRLDQRRNYTNRSAWQVLRGAIARRLSSHDTASDNRGARRRRRLLALVPVAVVGVVVAAATWLVVFRDGADGERGPLAAAQPEAGDGTDPDGAVTQQALQAGDSAPAGVAATVSQAAYPDGAENVVLTRQAPSVDALVAGGLQGLLDAPLLLTTSDELSPEAAAEIDRLGNPEIHMLGGTDAVAADIESQLAEAGHSMHRHAGPTGAETAVDIASRHFPDAQAAVLAPSFSADTTATETLAQAMIAGSYAAARQLPVLTSTTDTLSPATSAYLLHSDIDSVYVVGSTDQLSDEVLTSLESIGVRAQRIGGADAVGTAVAVAGHDSWPMAADGGTVVIADGTGDGLWPGMSVGAVYAGQLQAPTLLARGDDLPAATLAALQQRPDGTQVLCVTGVTEAACAAAQDAVSS